MQDKNMFVILIRQKAPNFRRVLTEKIEQVNGTYTSQLFYSMFIRH